MGIASALGDAAKGVKDFAVDTASTVVNTGIGLVASGLKIAFGQEAGMVIDPVANGASSLVNSAGTGVKKVGDAAVDMLSAGGNAALGALTPGATPSGGPAAPSSSIKI